MREENNHSRVKLLMPDLLATLLVLRAELTGIHLGPCLSEMLSYYELLIKKIPSAWHERLGVSIFAGDIDKVPVGEL